MKYLITAAFFGVCFLVNLLPTLPFQKIESDSIYVTMIEGDSLPHKMTAQSIKIRRMEIQRTMQDSAIQSKFSAAEAALKNNL